MARVVPSGSGMPEHFGLANTVGDRVDDNQKHYYRVFAPDVPNMPTVSERFTSEGDAKRLKREILMAYPAATVRIEKMDDFGTGGADPKSRI
jgi:hypothetical protein